MTASDQSPPDESRRAFLKGTVAGASAVAAGASLVETAQTAQTAQAQMPGQTAMEHAHASSTSESGAKIGAFLSLADSAAVDALSERIMPGAPGRAGAREAGVINYIDLALAGAYADFQEFYRRGCAALDQHCRATHATSFAELAPTEQDAVITAMIESKLPTFTWPTSQAFFATVRTHTMEGMFADPLYGGNKDFAGWRLVGFPGAQPLFTEADMASREAFTRGPILGLQAQVRRG
jgi:gluconate 2-dehydrogenase gamma chain